MTDEELFDEIQGHCSGIVRGIAIDKRINEFIDTMENGSSLDSALDAVEKRFEDLLHYDGKPYDIRNPIRKWWSTKVKEMTQESGG